MLCLPIRAGLVCILVATFLIVPDQDTLAASCEIDSNYYGVTKSGSGTITGTAGTT